MVVRNTETLTGSFCDYLWRSAMSKVYSHKFLFACVWNSFSLYPRLCLISFCSPGWPWTFRNLLHSAWALWLLVWITCPNLHCFVQKTYLFSLDVFDMDSLWIITWAGQLPQDKRGHKTTVPECGTLQHNLLIKWLENQICIPPLSTSLTNTNFSCIVSWPVIQSIVMSLIISSQ